MCIRKMFRGILIVSLLLIHESHAACDGKCLTKCCGVNQYVTDENKCLPNPARFDLSVLKVYDDELRERGRANYYFSIEYGAFEDDAIRDNAHISSMFYESTYLLQNGSSMLVSKTGANLYDITRYCIDYRVDENNTVSDNIDVWFFLSTEDNVPIIFKFSMIISCIFLVLVLVVYTLLPELRNLGGITLMAYVASLLFGFLFMFCIQVGASSFEPPVCFAMTLLTYFFLISSFGWMNALSYDIWWTFRGYAKARPIFRRGDQFKFRMYCVYSWGVPLVLATILGSLNDWSDDEPSFITMQIPLSGCFIEGKAKLFYLYVPMLIMILANWVFFVMTAFNIWRLSRGSDMLTTADSSVTGTAAARHNQKERFKVYVKLTVVMGLNWVFEVVSSFVPEWDIWYIFDVYNLLIGLIIFIIFVCKRNVYKLLKKRFNQGILRNRMSSTKTNSQTTNSAESTVLNMPLNHPDNRKRKEFPSM